MTKKTLMVTSPLPEEGKTQIALNMAFLSAASGQKTLLIDLDLRKRPTFMPLIKGEGQPDLIEYLNDETMTLDQITHEANGIDIIPSQRTAENIGALVSSSRLTKLLAEAAKTYDRIWIDTAPAGIFADARYLASKVDGTLLVVEWRRTSTSQAVATANYIHRSGGRVLGSIINGIEVDSTISYGMTVYEDYYR